ncbi:MAG: hypothetical protein WEB58_05325 [Planctomycetaceae bacterium]
MSINAADILSVTKAVTKKWEKTRKAEERGSRSRSSRQYIYSDRINFTDVMDKILPEAYQHASGGGKHWVKKRQLYYASRKRFKELTDRDIEAAYFSQTLLRKYMNTHPETASWKIAADARGHLMIPNAQHVVRVPVGTLEIDDHLRKSNRSYDGTNIDVSLPTEWPSIAPGQRYHAVLFIEKEGFEPMLEEAKIAERYDLAILSSKGQSTEAARRFIDETCFIDGGVPLFVLHDFDKAGFQIAKRLTTVGDWAEESDMVLYQFQHEINVTDLGLRLEDVKKNDLHWAAEKVPCSRRRSCKCFRCQPLCQSEYGITDDEYEYLYGGQRVELNALTTPQFIALIEAKLQEHGLHKRLIPADDDVLGEAWRRALAVAEVNSAIWEAQEKATAKYSEADVPKTLRKQIQKAMKDSPAAWDQVLYRMAQSKVNDETDD